MIFPFLRCAICEKDFPPTREFFYFRNGKVGTRCKACLQIAQKKRRKENKDANKEYQRQYSLNHKERKKELAKKWREENREKHRSYSRKYGKEHKEACRKTANAGEKRRLATSPVHRLKKTLRRRLRDALRAQNTIKTKTAKTLVGCSIPHLRLHIESLWSKGMTWENHGTFGWHIDHIIPCASFNLLDEEQQKKCFHYTNLQPLWASDNLKKGSKVL